MSQPRRQREPEAGRRTVDRRDHRLRKRSEPEHEPRHVLLIGEPVARLVAAVVAGRGAVAVEVKPGAEATPCAGEDHRAAASLGRDPAQLDVQRLAQLGGHRVELLGPVERELHNVRRGFLDEHKRVIAGASYVLRRERSSLVAPRASSLSLYSRPRTIFPSRRV